MHTVHVMVHPSWNPWCQAPLPHFCGWKGFQTWWLMLCHGLRHSLGTMQEVGRRLGWSGGKPKLQYISSIRWIQSRGAVSNDSLGLDAAVARGVPFLQTVICSNIRHKHEAGDLKHWRMHLKIKQVFTLTTISVTLTTNITPSLVKSYLICGPWKQRCFSMEDEKKKGQSSRTVGDGWLSQPTETFTNCFKEILADHSINCFKSNQPKCKHVKSKWQARHTASFRCRGPAHQRM